jgi:hypothetical protein
MVHGFPASWPAPIHFCHRKTGCGCGCTAIACFTRAVRRGIAEGSASFPLLQEIHLHRLVNRSSSRIFTTSRVPVFVRSETSSGLGTVEATVPHTRQPPFAGPRVNSAIPRSGSCRSLATNRSIPERLISESRVYAGQSHPSRRLGIESPMSHNVLRAQVTLLAVCPTPACSRSARTFVGRTLQGWVCRNIELGQQTNGALSLGPAVTMFLLRATSSDTSSASESLCLVYE